MKTSLVILAAGLGTRFKNGTKQAASVGPNGEWIMDFSIYDAIKSGFNRVIFVIRKDMQEIENIIRNKYEGKIDIEFAYQDVLDIPVKVSCNRVKPWGTGHAIYILKDIIKEPFCILNADDYCGRDSLKLMHDFLVNSNSSNTHAMAGFKLSNTLSLSGTVNRGILKCNSNELIDINETFKIDKDLNNKNGSVLSYDDLCSMGCIGLKPSIFDILDKDFKEFLSDSKNYEEEFLLPNVIKNHLNKDIKVEVYETSEKWIGITYAEDLESAREYFLTLTNNGYFPKSLF